MSLRRDGFFTKVVCDRCGAEHHTTEQLPVLAFYDATLRHGWKSCSDIPIEQRQGRRGVFCPDCQDAMTHETKEHTPMSQATTHPAHTDRLIPQYAKTSDPAAVAAVERNVAAANTWRRDARAFAERHARGPAAGQVMYTAGFGELHLTGIVSDGAPEAGRWKRGRRAGTWAPFKNNPLNAELEAIYYRPEDVPGLDPCGYYTGTRPDGAMMTHYPSTFVHDGVAYMRIAEQPERDQSHGWGDGIFDFDLWAEIMPSEWHLAHEAAEAKAPTR